MNAPYDVLAPIREGDWWGVYGPNGLIKAFRFEGEARKLCNELNYEAGYRDAGGNW